MLAITNLGALLLARDIGKFGELKYKAPRFVVYDGSDKLSHKTDLTDNKGYAVGFEGLFEFIMERIPVNIELKRAIRSNSPVYPPDAVREILANALIHQDFDSGTGNVTIELYQDRFEVKNPGQPIISTDRFIDESKSRNKALAYLMRRFGFCEEMGSGIDRVITAIELYQLPSLSVTTGLDSTSVCLYKYKKFDDMSQIEKSDACYQHCVLRFITKQKTNNQSVRERFNLDSRQTTTASRILADCVEAGKIKLEDPEKTYRKFVYYVPFWAQ